MRRRLAPVGAVLALTLACHAQPAQQPPGSSRHMVLEVVTTASGMVYPKEGDLLDFRLYDDGVFEYDDYPEQDPPRAMAGKVPIVTRQGRIGLDQVHEFVDLTRRRDLLDAKPHYAGIRPHIDDTWITHVRVPQPDGVKQIDLVNFWDTLSFPGDAAKYPASVVELLRLERTTKAKALGRKLDE